jgi:hypothetical protein
MIPNPTSAPTSTPVILGFMILTSAVLYQFNKTWKLVKSNPNKHVDFVEMNRNTLETDIQISTINYTNPL